MLYSELPLKGELKPLETERLILRIDNEETYAAALRTLSDADLKMHLGFATDAAIQAEKAKIVGGLTTYRTSLMYFHLVLKESNEVIGSFAYHNWFPMHSRSEIGYAMKAEDQKNKGYMKEAFPAMIAFGFDVMKLNRMEAFIHPDNMPSWKLVESADFQKEGLLKEHYCSNGITGDSMVYGLLKKDYYDRL